MDFPAWFWAWALAALILTASGLALREKRAWPFAAGCAGAAALSLNGAPLGAQWVGLLAIVVAGVLSLRTGAGPG
ncbi:MAG: hypothetical protein WC971_09345 [Coriobacteriia bacterium]